MNDADMIQIITDGTGCSKATARTILHDLFSKMAGELQAGGQVRLPELGRLTRTAHAATAGHNPRTGEPITVPAQYRARFSAGSRLKSRLATLPPPVAAKAAD